MCEIRCALNRLVGAATAMAAGRPAKSRNATATEPTSSSVSPELTAYPRALARDTSFSSFAWVVIDRSGTSGERLGGCGVQLGDLVIGHLGEQSLAQRRAVRRHEGSRPRHHTQGALGLDRVDVADLFALQDAEVDSLAELGGQLLHHRPGLLPDIQRTDDGQAHLDQRGTGDVGPGDGLLLDEAVVGEHGE